MKIVYMGTPDFAVPALKALMSEHEVVCVYTQAPKEAGRGNKLTKTPVHLFAEASPGWRSAAWPGAATA